jgi:branched-chain amino acid transport system substrate-binding protein
MDLSYHKNKIILFFFIVLCFICTTWGVICFNTDRIVFNVAVVGPMTGKNAANGRAMEKGIYLCLKNAKQNRSLKNFHINIEIFDDKNDISTAKKIASQIVDKQSYHLVIGHYFSSTSKAAGEIYKQNQIPAITASATDISLIKNNDWYFRVVPGNDIQGSFIAYYIHNILKVQKIHIIYENDVYGQDLVNNFEKSASILKVKTKKWNISEGSFDNKISQIIYELQSTNEEEVVFIATHADKGAKIVSLIKYPGAKFIIIGSDSFATDAFINALKQESSQERAFPGYHSNGIHTVSAFLNDVGNQKSQFFIKNFNNYYQENPSWVSASYYDAMLLAINVFNEVGAETDATIEEKRKNIKTQLLSINTYDEAVHGITGKLFLNKCGDVVQPYFVGVYYDQNLVSSLDQYQLTSQTISPNKVLQKILEGKMIKINKRFMNKTSVVYTGMSINKISNINLFNKMYTVDFYLWFRYNKDLQNVVDIEFENSASPLFLNEKIAKAYDVSNFGKGNNIITILLDKIENNVAIKAFRIKSTFLNDFNFRSFPFDRHQLNIKFKHQFLTNDKIIFIPDNRGMKKSNLIGDNMASRKISIEGWETNKIFFYPTVISNQSSLGDPSAFKSMKTLKYSCFNSEVEIKRKVFSFILKNLLLTFVLIIVTYIIYFIPEDQFSTRISLSMSVLLTTAFSHIRMSSSIQVSYLFAAEYVFFGVYSIAALSIIMSVLVYHKNKTEAAGNTIEDIKKATYFSIIRLMGLMVNTFIILLIIYYISYNHILDTPSEKEVLNITLTFMLLLGGIIVLNFLIKSKKIEQINT